ncbi:MAG: metal-dependent hydrolase [Acidobacteria bacterium]|nr:metal-dependent hydrolase [Acidobacteriota bacterium]
MDTITHGITGALIAKSFSEREGRIATLAVTLGSVFPDIDTFVTWFYDDGIAFLKIHRGVTHSVVMLPVFALVFGAITCILSRRKNKWLLFSMLYGIGIASHIFLDLITAYGTMIWSPVSYARYSWDVIFIVDLVFSGIVLLPQLVAWAYSNRAKTFWRACAVWGGSLAVAGGIIVLARNSGIYVSISTFATAAAIIALILWAPSWRGAGYNWRPSAYCRAGIAAVAIYLSLCAVAHRAAVQRVTQFAIHKGLSIDGIAALPAPPSLWRWAGLVRTSEGTYRSSIDLASSRETGYEFFANAANETVRRAESLPDVQTFLWFARFPWITLQRQDGMEIVQISDIQFLRPRRGTPPFTFQVLVDREGRILRSGLLNR